jgi:hypothetical protein
MKIKAITCFLGALFLLGSVSVFAHHQFSTEFDKSKPVTLSGTIAKVEWNNPHAYIYMDVKNESGKMEQWKLEAASPEFLMKQGVKETTFKKGEKLTVNAYGATKTALLASARMATTADGHSMQVSDPKEDGGPAK